VQRYELRRHVTRRIAQGRRLGAPAPGAELRLSVLLHPKDGNALAEATRDVADPASAGFGQFMRPEELKRFVAPGYQDLDAVLAWLHDVGLSPGEPTGLRTVIPASGTVEAVSKALDTPIGRYAFGRTERLSIERNPTIPAALAPLVRGIAGLNTLPGARRFPAIPGRRSPKTSGPSGLTPDSIRAAYGLPSRGGAGERVAILEMGGGYSLADFDVFCETFELPQGDVHDILVRGAGPSFGKSPGSDAEVAADMDWVRAMAPDAAIDLFWVENDDCAWVDFLATLLDTPEESRPGVVSISWGMPEDGLTTSRRYDQARQLFESACLLGITFVAASGDAGASGLNPADAGFDGQPHVDFPASLPEVTGVGGTALARDLSEKAWSNADGASGGGFSRYVRIPTWQKAALKKSRSVFRGVPDVSAVASTEPGLAVHVRRKWTALGGTGVAAPIWAGLLTHVNAARVAAGKPRLGSANPSLYSVAGKGSPYRDVSKGQNTFGGVPGFAAVAGWDPVTGLGSANLAKLVTKLK